MKTIISTCVLVCFCVANAAGAVSLPSLISVNRFGTGTGDQGSSKGIISDDGRHVLFFSGATNLVDAPPEPPGTIFIYSRDRATGITSRIVLSGPPPAGLRASVLDIAPSSDARFISFRRSTFVVATGVTVSDVYVRDVVNGVTELISVNKDGSGPGNGQSDAQQISSDGKLVFFTSQATDLVENDGNGRSHDVFVRNRETGVTTLLSINSLGNSSAFGVSNIQDITPDGKFVVFNSTAGNLAGNDTNETLDIYVRNLTTGTTTLVSQNAAGTDSGNGASNIARISDDGRYVVFVSGASNLGPVDNNSLSDVYVRDLEQGSTSLVSVNRFGTASGNGSSSSFSISGDGRVVTFQSGATDLTDAAPVAFLNIYSRNLDSGITQLVSTDSTGLTSANNNSSAPVISKDGRVVAFESFASNIAPNDNNGTRDIYVKNLLTGKIFLASVNRFGTGTPINGSTDPRLNADGRVVIFQTQATDLVENDFNGVSPDIFAFEQSEADISGFDVCISSGNGGDSFSLNSQNGQYRLCAANGVVITGRSRITARGCTIQFDHIAPDRRINGRVDTCSRQGSVVAQFPLGRIASSITDRNTGDGSCGCN